MLAIDQTYLDAIQSTITPWLTPIMRAVSAVMVPRVVVPICMVILAVLFIRHRRLQDVLLILILSGNLVTVVLKPIIDRPRPTATQATIIDRQADGSMPSGHATAAMTIGGAIVLLAHHRQRASRKLVASVTGGILLVGFSRVYLGAHWPSDVLVGYLIGFAWIVFIWRFVRPLLLRHRPTYERQKTTTPSGVEGVG